MLTGIAMIALGYSIVFWASTLLPSWIVAVLTSTSCLWTYLGESLVLRSKRLRIRVLCAVMIGMIGIALVGGTALHRELSLSSWAVAGVLAASISWSASTLAIQRIHLPKSSWQTAGLQLTAAGILLAGISAALGEWTRLPAIDRMLATGPVLAMTYLVFGGSVIAFGSFHWLIRRDSPSLVSTFAYANPVVAMIVGIGFAHESCSMQQFFGAVAILFGIVLMWRAQADRGPSDTGRKEPVFSSGVKDTLDPSAETAA
jgi:drug/metabolite transporter (DMT)-like permease